MCQLPRISKLLCSTNFIWIHILDCFIVKISYYSHRKCKLSYKCSLCVQPGKKPYEYEKLITKFYVIFYDFYLSDVNCRAAVVSKMQDY